MKRGKGTRPSTEYHPKSPAFRGIWVRPWGKRRDESKAISRFHNLPSPAITCHHLPSPALMRTPTLRRAATWVSVCPDQPDLGVPRKAIQSSDVKLSRRGSPVTTANLGSWQQSEFVAKALTIFEARVTSCNEKLPIIRIARNQIQIAGKEQLLQGTKKQDPPALQHSSPVAAGTSCW